MDEKLKLSKSDPEWEFFDEIKQKVHSGPEYDESQDPKAPDDTWGPRRPDCLTLDEAVVTKFLDDEAGVDSMKEALLGSKLLGIKSRGYLFEPALLCIGNATHVFLIDMLKLRDNEVLDKALAEILAHDKSVTVTVGYRYELETFSQEFPKMRFWRLIAHVIDIQREYARVMPDRQFSTWTSIIKDFLGHQRCTVEYNSDFSRRPLRLAQKHFAALDVNVLVKVMEALAGRAKDKCLSGYEEFMHRLDLEQGQGIDWDKRDCKWYLDPASVAGDEQLKRKPEEKAEEPPAKRQ